MTTRRPPIVPLQTCPILVGMFCTLLIAGPSFAQDEPKTPTETARIALSRGENDRALDILRRAVESDPKSALLQNELGVALFQTAAYDKAITAFEAAVKLDPNLAHAWANLGEARRLTRRYKKAAIAFHKFLQLRKGDRYGIYGMALSFEGYESYEKAMKTLSVAEGAAAADKPLLARINVARRRIQEKLREAGQPLLQRGDARFVAGRYRDALGIYAKGARKSPKDATFRGRLGLTYAIMGDNKRATAQLQAALQLDPNEPVANYTYAALARTTATGGDGLTLRDLLRQDRAALATARSGDTPTMERAEASLRMGRLDDAIAAAPAQARGEGVRAEVHVLRGETKDADDATGRTGAPVAPADLPVWRRSLLTR